MLGTLSTVTAPHQTALQYNASNYNGELLFRVFLISHKYGMESLQTFAAQLLIHHCMQPNGTSPTGDLPDIVRIAVQMKFIVGQLD
jgi:hypothetical protein